jgi:small basic protein
LLNIVPGFGLGSLLQGNMGGAFVQFLYQGLIPVTSFTRVYLIYGFAYILNLPMTDDTDDYWKSVNGIALDAMLSSFLVASPFAITTGIISAIMYKPGLPNEIINTIYLNQLTLIGLGSYFQGDRIGGVIQTSLFISCFVFNLIGSILVDPLYYYISIGILALDLTAGIIFPFIKGDNVSID